MPFTKVRMDIPRLDPTSMTRIDASRVPASAAPAKQAEWEAALNAQRLQTDVPARLNLAEAIIRREKQTLSEQNLTLSYPARLRVPDPPAASPTAAPAVAATEAAAPAAALASAAPSETLLPLNEITQQQGLLNRADVHFDPTTNRWSAEWPSPRPFHYGMVLKPTLTQFIKDGQSFSFQNGSDQAQTITNRGGEIVVANKNSSSQTVLDSQGLRHLLTDKIKSNGFELYLTQTGSLVLATTGNLARSMALAH